MPITIPEFITKSAVVRPDLLAETPDPQTDVTHEEWNALVDLAVAAAGGVNDLESGTGGPQLLFDMPIATASVGTAVFVRPTADTGSESGTPTSSVAAALSDPSRNVLRLTTDGGNCWIWPVVLPIALPADGYAVEVEIARWPPSTWYGAVMPIADFSGAAVRGVGFRSWDGATNVDLFATYLGTGPTLARNLDLTPPATPSGWGTNPTNAVMESGPCRVRCEVRRTASQTPARWALRMTFQGHGPDSTCSISGVSNAIAGLDGQPFAGIGLGIYGGAGDLDIQSLRVWSL